MTIRPKSASYSVCDQTKPYVYCDKTTDVRNTSVVSRLSVRSLPRVLWQNHQSQVHIRFEVKLTRTCIVTKRLKLATHPPSVCRECIVTKRLKSGPHSFCVFTMTKRPKSASYSVCDQTKRYVNCDKTAASVADYISANSWSICTKCVVLIDTGNTSVSSGPKYHFTGIKDDGGRHLGKYIKGVFWPFRNQYAPYFVRW